MFTQRQSCFRVVHWISCLSVLAFFGFKAVLIAEDPLNVIALEFVAEFKDEGGYQRLTGVLPTKESLAKLKINPGDSVTYKVQKQVVVVERWSQEFKWEKREKRGKDTIIEITHQQSFKKIDLEFGVSIAPRFILGTVKIDASILDQQTPQDTKNSIRGNESVGPSGVKPEVPPTISRPPAAPANATPEGKPSLTTFAGDGKTVLKNGDVIPGCTLILTIQRASK